MKHRVDELTHYACRNRKSFKPTLTVQDGYKPDGTRNMVEVPFRMSRACEYARTELGEVDVRCGDCWHRASDHVEPSLPIERRSNA